MTAKQNTPENQDKSYQNSLYPEDQKKVDEFLARGVNSVERKPFRPMRLMIMLIVGMIALVCLAVMAGLVWWLGWAAGLTLAAILGGLSMPTVVILSFLSRDFILAIIRAPGWEQGQRGLDPQGGKRAGQLLQPCPLIGPH